MNYPAASGGVSSKTLNAPRGGVLHPGFAINPLQANVAAIPVSAEISKKQEVGG